MTTKPWRDLIGFFLLGILSDALPGFFSAATVVKDLDIPYNLGMAPLQLSADVGGVVGVLFTSFVLSRFLPEVRVLVNNVLQLVGLALTWVLPYPSNMIGISLLTVGFVGILTTVLPLTVYKPGSVTNAFQFGYAVGPIFGAAIVTVGEALNIGHNGLFAIAICWPFIVALSFFVLIDRSPWREGGFWNLRADKKIEATDASPEVVAVATGKELEDVPLEDVESQSETNELPQARPTNKIAESVKFDSKPISCQDRLSAVREIAITYLPFWIVACLTSTLWGCAVQLPFLTSIVTYAGLEAEGTEDMIILVGLIGVLLIGVSVVLPYVGRFLSHMNALYLWIPTIVQLAMVIIATVAVYGLFKPLSVGAAFTFQLVITMAFYCVSIYAPIIVRNDAKLTPRYQEFQLQALQITLNVSYLTMDIICLFIASPALYGACKTHLEQAFSGVSCNY